jgi:hypothetical protein
LLDPKSETPPPIGQVRGRSGLYFNGLREARAHAQVDDTEARRRLRRLSLELTGLADD